MPNRRAPTSAVARVRRVAGMPWGVATRAARDAGRRLSPAGRQQELSFTERAHSELAEDIFATLGELKGAAMKVGQQLSIFEAAIPPEWSRPYRSALTQLQEHAPAVPFAQLEPVLNESLEAPWRELFADLDEQPCASASIGQVHAGHWHDGSPVAVKIQYPWAAEALESDLGHLSYLSKAARPLVPGMDLGAIVQEVRERMIEEVDYRREAWSQTAFAQAYDGDAQVAIPEVVAHGERALVTRWMEGTPLNALIAAADRGETSAHEELERIAPHYLGFLLGAPGRLGLLHADPHPGNFRVLADGRLGVLDFGAVDRLPDGLPPAMGQLLSLALAGAGDALVDGLREEGFIRDRVELEPEALLRLFEPLIAPIREPTFEFTREWMQEVSRDLNDPRGEAFAVSRHLNLPAQYLLIHRTWLGGTAVTAQMGVRVPARDVAREHVDSLHIPNL